MNIDFLAPHMESLSTKFTILPSKNLNIKNSSFDPVKGTVYQKQSLLIANS